GKGRHNPPSLRPPPDTSRSVLLYRIAKTGSGRMPHVGSDVVDDRGVALIGRWIAQLPSPAVNSFAKISLGNDAKLNELLKTPQGALAELYTLVSSDVSKEVREK